jgi:hypothetical protein
MTAEPVELDALLAARERMMRELQQGLSADERRFLLSLVAAEPEWSLLGVPHLQQLPGRAGSCRTWNVFGRPTPENSPSNRTHWLGYSDEYREL